MSSDGIPPSWDTPGTKDLSKTEALKKSEAHLRLAQSAARIGSWDWNLETGELNWSDEIYRIYGLEPQECETTFELVWEYTHPDDKEHMAKAVEAAREHGKEYEIQYRITLPDGAIRYVNGIGVPVKDEAGKVIRIYGTGQDITERKQAEERLKESEERWRSLSEGSLDHIMLLDKKGTIDFINHTVPDLTRGEVIGRSCLDFTPPEYHRVVTDCFERVIQSGSSDSYETEFTTKEGETRYFEVRITPLKDRDGEMSGLISISRDITERKRVEQELFASEGKLRTVIDHSHEVYYIHDTKHRLSYVSPRCVDVFGYTPEEMMVKWTTLVTDNPINEEGFKQTEKAMVSGERQASYVLEVKRKDGELRWIEIDESPVRDASGNIIAISGALRDITERKQATEALRASEQRFREMAEMLPQVIYEADLNGILTFVNRGAYEISGYTREDFDQGLSALEMLIPADRPKAIENMGAILDGTATGPNEYTALRKDGGTYPVTIHSNTVVRSGEIVGLRGIIFDDTDRKKAEEEKLALERQVQHAQKLESLGVLAGGIAHDFNNLLMTILGNADLAIDSLSPMSPARHNLQEIEKASRHGADLVRQMLAYSGRGQFVVQPINSNELIEEMTHLLGISISKKASLKLNLESNLPLFKGDVAQVRQVLMNLITNASEAIGDSNGVIALSTSAVECDREFLDAAQEAIFPDLDEPLAEGKYVCLEVADTGCGMDAEAVGKIFDPFYTTKFTGRGLGMSAVLGIVRGHKGALTINSEVGKGTVVKLYLPAADRSVVSASGPSEEAGADAEWRGSGTILFVDDEEQIRTIGKQMLEHLGFNVLTASDGREALRVYRDNSDEIVCVMLDLTMPRMDGSETFREMKRLDPNVRVILCSGYDEHDATEQFIDKGLAGFLQKPSDISTMRERLKGVLGEAQRVRQ